MNPERQRVVLADLPAPLLTAALEYLAEVRRECQLVLIAPESADPTLAGLAAGLVPDLEELRELFRAADFEGEGDRRTVGIDLSGIDAATLAHLRMQLDQLRFLDQRGQLLLSVDPEVTSFLAWVWDEAAEQLNGRSARAYRIGSSGP